MVVIRDGVFVAFFAWIGVLMRIALGEIYDHTFIHGNIPGPLTRTFYPNMIGCIILGILVSFQSRIKDRYPPLYAGLASGLCGSLTTFSSLSQEASLQLIDHNVTTFFAVLLLGFACPYWIMQFVVNLMGYPNYYIYLIESRYLYPVSVPGSAPLALTGSSNNNFPPNHANYGSTIAPSNIPSTPSTPGENDDDATGIVVTSQASQTSPTWPSTKIFYALSLLIGTAIFLMLILLIAFQSHSHTWILFSCIFAPFGAVTRWYLATYNSSFPKFPIFTFLVNMIGSLFLAAFVIWELHVKNNNYGYAALAGAVTGFCGSLTTVSTFENELRVLETKYSIVYALVSIFGTQLLLLAINGGYHWS